MKWEEASNLILRAGNSSALLSSGLQRPGRLTGTKQLFKTASDANCRELRKKWASERYLPEVRASRFKSNRRSLDRARDDNRDCDC